MAAGERKRLAWFTANHPTGGFSAGAYLSDLLLRELRQDFDVELFCEHSGIELGGIVSRNFLTANIINKSDPFDYYLYNFENKKFRNFLRIHLGLMPGIVWFHQFNLSDDGPEPILNSPWSRMIELFNNPDVESFWPGQEDEFIPRRPPAFRESGLSLAAIFSCERDLAQYMGVEAERLNHRKSSVFLPLPLAEESFSRTTVRVLNRNVGLCGKPDADSHLHSLFMAVRRNPEGSLFWMIESSERRKCTELISEFGLKNVCLQEGLSVQNWQKLSENCGICVHFLQSHYEQLQPWLGCSLAQGKNCLLLNFGEADHIPNQVAIKICCGINEVSEICGVLSFLSRTEFCQNHLAIRFAHERYNLQGISAEFKLYLRQISSDYQALRKKWEKLEDAGRQKMIEDSLEGLAEFEKIFLREAYERTGFLRQTSGSRT